MIWEERRKVRRKGRRKRKTGETSKFIGMRVEEKKTWKHGSVDKIKFGG